MGGEGGAIGECQDSVLWNESDDPAGEPGSVAPWDVFSTTLSKVKGDVCSFRGGAVAARRDAKAANLVRLTRSSPTPSETPASWGSDSSTVFFCACTSSACDGFWISIASSSTVVSFCASIELTPLPSDCVVADTPTDGIMAGIFDSHFFEEGDSATIIESRSCSISRVIVSEGASEAEFKSAFPSSSGVVMAVICGNSSLAFPASSGGIAVRGGVIDSGSSTSGLNAISDTRLLGGLVGVSVFFFSDSPVASASDFVSGVAGAKLRLDVSKPKSECRRAFGV